MPVLKNSYEIIEDIRGRLRGKGGPWCIMRFEESKYFNREHSVIEPLPFVEVIESLLHCELEFVGGWTDRGIDKLVDVYENLKEYLSGKREKTGFINLYCVFFRRRDPPSGILAMLPTLFVFIPAVDDPREPILLRVLGISRSEKQGPIKLAARHKLELYGEPDRPILYRRSMLNVDDAKKFVADVLSFFEDAGYAEV